MEEDTSEWSELGCGKSRVVGGVGDKTDVSVSCVRCTWATVCKTNCLLCMSLHIQELPWLAQMNHTNV
jgi:hypothetical protein